MSNEWILDVLTDLHSFADQNGMPVLAAEIARTKDVAVLELASRETERATDADEGAATTGTNPGWFGHRRLA